MLYPWRRWFSSINRRVVRAASAKSRRVRLAIEVLEDRVVPSHMGDEDFAIMAAQNADPNITGVQSLPPGDGTGPAPAGFPSYATLANGIPILNSLPGAPTAIYLDFDGDTSGSNPYGDHT